MLGSLMGKNSPNLFFSKEVLYKYLLIFLTLVINTNEMIQKFKTIITCFFVLANLTICLAQKQEIDHLLDAWHMAATKADSLAYFSLMDDPSVFVGTDSFEVWEKKAFISFAGPYFAKGKAWSFTKITRNIYLDPALPAIGWFDEMLDTWMGPCRGSGLVVKKGNKWLIKHYVLSVTVPNDKIQQVIKAIAE